MLRFSALPHFRPQSANTDYSSAITAGTRRVRLDAQAWSEVSDAPLIAPDLYCYFTDIDTGQRVRIVMLAVDGYEPKDRSLDMLQLKPGIILSITIGPTVGGSAVLRHAHVISDMPSFLVD